MGYLKDFAPFVPATMDDLLSFAIAGVAALPTFVMSCWVRSRRFAHFPLPALALMSGGIIAYRLGELHRLRMLDPKGYFCGMPDYFSIVFFVWIGTWVLAAGLVLIALKSTRIVGRRILLWGAPLYVLACVLGYVVGRYAGG